MAAGGLPHQLQRAPVVGAWRRRLVVVVVLLLLLLGAGQAM